MAEVAVPRALRGRARSSSARATTRTPATSSGPATPAPCASTPTAAQITLATFGPGDIFGELAMFDDERRSATVEAVDDLDAVAILGRDMRAAAAPPSGDRGQARDRARPPPARGQRAPRAPVVPDRAEPRGHGGGPARRAGAGGRRGEQRRAVTATQAELAQLAGSSRESAWRFLAVLERAGVITQGRGRLTVHDPGRSSAMSSEEPPAASTRSPTAASSSAPRPIEVVVIAPRRQRRRARAPQGRRRAPGESGGGRRRARGARGDRPDRRRVREPLGDVDVLVPARRPASPQDRPLLPVATTSTATSPTTTTRSRRRAGCRWTRRARELTYPGRARDGGARAVQVAPRTGRVPRRCRP